MISQFLSNSNNYHCVVFLNVIFQQKHFRQNEDQMWPWSMWLLITMTSLIHNAVSHDVIHPNHCAGMWYDNRCIFRPHGKMNGTVAVINIKVMNFWSIRLFECPQSQQRYIFASVRLVMWELSRNKYVKTLNLRVIAIYLRMTAAVSVLSCFCSFLALVVFDGLVAVTRR